MRYIIILLCVTQSILSSAQINKFFLSGKTVYQGSFTPADFSNQAYWFRGDDVNTTSTNVDKLVNKYGNTTYDAAKVSDGTRPDLVSGPNSKNAIQFVSSNNDLLQATNFPSLNDFTLFVVFKASSTSGTQTIIQNQDLATQGFKVRISSGTISLTVQNSGDAGSGTTTTSFAFTDVTDYHVLTIKYYKQRIAEQTNGTQAIMSRVVIKLDNVVKISQIDQRRTVASTAVTKIGSDSNNNSLNCTIAEIVALSKYATETDELNYYGYVNNYFGLSVTETMPTYYIQSAGLIVNPSTTGYDAAMRIQFKVCIPNTASSFVPLICAPGYGENYNNYTSTVMNRFASYGLCVIAVNHRGIGSSGGSQDDGARQAHDYYDVLEYMRDAHPDVINQTAAAMYGISAGGGDTYACAVKFPDLFSVSIAHFGMADYGYDNTYGWWNTTVAFRTNLQTNIGDTPSNVPNNYRARYHKESVAQYRGYMYMFHDASDTAVPVSQSDRVKDVFDLAGFTNYSYYRSASPDAIRYTHAYPTDAGTTGIATGEQYWKNAARDAVEVNIPDAGSMTINGYLITKKFKIWLGDGTSSREGRTRSASLVYDWAANTYTVTPILETGATDETVNITVLSGANQGKTSSATISSETTFVPGYFYDVSTSQSGRTISVSFSSETNQNQPPSIYNVTLSGGTTKTDTLIATVEDFYSPGGYAEGTHTYQWYRSSSIQSVGTAITNDTLSYHIEVDADVAKYVRCGVRGRQIGGMNPLGSEVTSVYSSQISDNVFNPFTDITWHVAHRKEDATDLSGVGWENLGTGNNSIKNGSDPIPTYVAGQGVDFESSNNEELVLDNPSPQLSFPITIIIRGKFESFNAAWGYLLSLNSSQIVEQRTSGAMYLSGGNCSYTASLNKWTTFYMVLSGSANTSKFQVNWGTIKTDVAASTTAIGTSDGMIGANAAGTGNRADILISHIFIKGGSELSGTEKTNVESWFNTNAPHDP